MITWGISANSHDAAIAVTQEDQILFASQSERYSKVKNDPHLNPRLLEDALYYGKPDYIVWYEKPWLKTLRQLRSGQGLINNSPYSYMSKYGIHAPIKTVSHHEAHASAGYFTSKFKDAAILIVDAIGEFDTTTIWSAQQTKLRKLYSSTYPHSLGLWYSAMTQRIGLKPNEEEYILMGMAAYGDPWKYLAEIEQEFFESGDNLKLKHNLHRGCMWWKPELNSEQDKYDIAASTQYIYSYQFYKLLKKTKQLVGGDNLVLGGGCALNCSANTIATNVFKNVWIMPNPGDAGNSLGAIASVEKSFFDWKGPYLGYNIEGKYPTQQLVDKLLTDKIVGVANGRAEFGPRALGHRSLLADPREIDIKDKVNEIKRRQKFRPFAPSILQEHANDYFDMNTEHSPYMQYVVKCKRPDEFPAIIHKDGTSRVQTVSKNDSPEFHKFLTNWYQETGCPMVLNTSLNIKGQPIVNDDNDAQQFVNRYGVDVL